jgi:ubiquinone biosynthesis monooxygenase Coq7
MQTRIFSSIDLVLGEIDKAIKTLSTPARSSRAVPGVLDGQILPPAQRAESGRLMRVNHAGEIAAQALYQGQAFTSRDPTIAAAMQHAAAEEIDHLAWCETRLRELRYRPSLLNPLWYAGSFAIGALAGALGRRGGLGFVAETERQVESHLRGHVKRLGDSDGRSRAILEQMTRDETQHGAQATSLGGRELPYPVAAAMRLASRFMTHGSYWL